MNLGSGRSNTLINKTAFKRPSKRVYVDVFGGKMEVIQNFDQKNWKLRTSRIYLTGVTELGSSLFFSGDCDIFFLTKASSGSKKAALFWPAYANVSLFKKENIMLIIDKHGKVINFRVKLKISLAIEKKPMSRVRGIIVHQSVGSTAESAFNSYNSGRSGAHFLIDKDGTIYQTASLIKQTWHVGKLKPRCLAEMKCSPTELNLLKKFDPSGTHRREMAKSVPDRYPSNQDSIGIEIVGQAFPVNEPDHDKRTYEVLTKEQSDSLKWIIQELKFSLKVPLTEIFRHPVVSYKNKTEAATASW